MQLKLCFLALVAASISSARDICGTPTPTEEQIWRAVSLQAQDLHAENRDISLVNKTAIEINVYFHVIAKNKTEAGGLLSAGSLSDQFKVLQDAFKPHNITFKLGKGDISVAPNWSDNCMEGQMKQRLQKGTYADLNVYFFPSMACLNSERLPHDRLLGYVTDFPDDKTANTERQILDAVHIRADTVPGGRIENFNMGMTLVHEVGHWLGLFHTFQGGCYGHGDGVSDTPYEDDDTANYYSGTCNRRRDSCAQPGLDPVENYMDYSADYCLNQFTPGQRARMFSQWSRYRAQHKIV